MLHIQPAPIGKPYFFDLPAVRAWLDWLMMADPAERDQFLGGDAGAEWANRIHLVLKAVEAGQVGSPCLTLSPPTDGPRAAYPQRPVPLRQMSIGDLTDLLIAFAAGEVSEGFLRDITGLPGDAVRALWFEAVARAAVISDRWISTCRTPASGTPDPPASSPAVGPDSGSSGPGPTGSPGGCRSGGRT